MQVQERAEGMDLWFVTDAESHKLDELEHDSQVNLAFYKNRTREWVSVSGRAEIVRDRERIRELYKADWKAWFPDEGGNRNGGPDDPRLALIVVDAQSVVYSKSNKPQPLALYEIVKGMVTGKEPDVADLRHLDGHELH
jgi:general stress protein 26